MGMVMDEIDTCISVKQITTSYLLSVPEYKMTRQAKQWNVDVTAMICTHTTRLSSSTFQ